MQGNTSSFANPHDMLSPQFSPSESCISHSFSHISGHENVIPEGNSSLDLEESTAHLPNSPDFFIDNVSRHLTAKPANTFCDVEFTADVDVSTLRQINQSAYSSELTIFQINIGGGFKKKIAEI